MNSASDAFAGILASAVLDASGEEVQAAVVDDMVERLDREGDLESQLAQAREVRKEAGDFGAEIAGAVIVPVLIEAAKALWAAYAKKLGEKVGGELADLTYKEVAKIVSWLWSGATRGQAELDFDALIRVSAGKHGLSSEQVEVLIAASRSPEMLKAIEARAQA
jgi:hypothetical protein